MLKKVIPIVIALYFIFSINVMAENENIVVEDTVPEMSEQISQEGRGNVGVPSSGEMPTRDIPPNMSNGKMPPQGMNRGERPSGNFTPPQNGGEITSQQGDFIPPQENNANNTAEAVYQMGDDTSAEGSQTPSGNQQFGGQMPVGMGGFPGNMQNFNGQTQEEVPTGFLGFVKTYSTSITSVVLLGLAFIFVVFYRRKNY